MLDTPSHVLFPWLHGISDDGQKGRDMAAFFGWVSLPTIALKEVDVIVLKRNLAVTRLLSSHRRIVVFAFSSAPLTLSTIRQHHNPILTPTHVRRSTGPTRN